MGFTRAAGVKCLADNQLCDADDTMPVPPAVSGR
jgi:hypothetical protein